MNKDDIIKLTKLIRYYILKMTHKAGSGHPTSSFSSVELATVLFFKHLRFDLDHPEYLHNDRFILSKGHASALFYSLYAAAGKVSEDELYTYREFQSVLEGHPTNRFRYTEAATGSLGQGLSIAAGEAWAINKYFPLDNPHPYVYILLGDGELAEGSIWEAAAWSSLHKLSNLIALVDVNKFGQSEMTMYKDDVEVYKKRFEAFNWHSIVIDGHDIDQIDKAIETAQKSNNAPTVILAKTTKGKGIDVWEDKDGWHNKMLSDSDLTIALEKFKVDDALNGKVQSPIIENKNYFEPTTHELKVTPPEYKKDDLVTTKKAFGNMLERLGPVNNQLLVLDGDVSNSLHTDQFKKKFPDRFLQMYIAEQNMVGVASGLAKRGYVPIVTTFASFLSRAADQIRMIHLTGSTVLFNGSYVGVSLGKDGPSQMGLSDIAQFRSLPGSTVLYPSDPYMTEYLTAKMITQKGVVYLRTTREATPVLYSNTDEFPIGESKVFVSNLKDNKNRITLVAAGITVHESLKAQKQLEVSGTSVVVLDCYTIKPIDKKRLVQFAQDSIAILVIEDHYPEGGLGDAVREVLSVKTVPIYHLAVHKVPMSGSASELLKYAEIDAESIVIKVKQILQ